jgi:hypothetical protein
MHSKSTVTLPGSRGYYKAVAANVTGLSDDAIYDAFAATDWLPWNGVFPDPVLPAEVSRVRELVSAA